MIAVFHRGGGNTKMITILHRGRGSLGTPKNDYVIARPHIGIYSSCRQVIDIKKIHLGIIKTLSISKNVYPNSPNKLNWKHCSKNMKESVSYPRWIWNPLCTKCTMLLRSNTRRASWMYILSIVIAFLSQTWLGGIYPKSYRNWIYRSFSIAHPKTWVR